MLNYRPATTAKTILRWCFGLLMVFGLSGCALIHENGELSAKISPDQIRIADDIHLAALDGWPSARWWESYNDPQLDTLIDQALNNAPTVAAARSRVEQARARVELVRSITGFQADAMGKIDRMHASSGGMTGPLAANIQLPGGNDIKTGPWWTTGTVGILGSYQLDIWGKHRNQINAAIGLQNAQLAEQASIELEISTTVAQLYYDIQATLQTVALLEQVHEIVAETVAAHAARASHGLASDTLTEEARAQLLAIEQQVNSAQTMIRQLREGLRALVGAHADNLPEIVPVPLTTVQVGLPATLSYELLSRRPDLQAMHWLVQASVDQIAASRAAFYPSFDIKVFYGFTSLHYDKLFLTDNQQFNIVPGVTLPIFDGSRLNANLKNATAAGNEAIARYNQAVLNAVKDVATAGTRLQGLKEEEWLQAEKLKSVIFIKKSAEAHYQHGLADKITALNANLPVNAEEIALLGIHRNQISQSIALVKALGGGYHVESEADEAP